MQNKLEMKTFSVNNADKIPKNQGLYAFYLDLISPSKIGLIGNDNFTDAQLKRAKELLLKRISKCINIVRSDRLSGELRETGKSDHITRRYSIFAEGISSEYITTVLSELPYEHVYNYSILSGMLSIFAQPVYVGISKDQTLFARYSQHKNDYENSNDKSKFGVRVKELELDWDELIFSCIEIDDPTNDNLIIRTLEKQMQAISMPLLSKK